MKKVFLALVLGVLVLSLAACRREYDAPTFSGVEDGTILQGATFDPMEGVTATDYEGNDLTSEIEVEGFVNSLILGEHVVTYSVTDSQGKTTEVNRFITVVFETSDPFALYNGDFSLDTGGWTLDTPGGSADFEVVDNMLVADITSAGSQWWQIQVHQMVTITEGETYRFSIEAKSDTAKRLGLGMEDTADGYAMLPGGNVAFELTDTLETYEFIYTSDRSVDTAKFVIYLGQIGDDDLGTDVTINEVSIERITLEDTDVTFTGVEDAVVVIGDAFDPLAGVSASAGTTDLTSSITVVGLVKTNVGNSTPYIVQYVVEHEGDITVYNRFVEVILGQDDPSSIFNPNFENGSVGWTFDFPVGEGTMSVVDGELIADLTDLGTAWWHIQLSQGGLHIEEGNSYLVTIVAKSSTPRRIGLGIEDTADNFADLKGENIEFNLTTEYETYTYVFNATKTIETVKYAIFMGQIASTDDPSTVTVDTFSVELLDDAYPTISGATNKRIEEGTVIDLTEGVTASDTEDGDLTSAIVIDGTVDNTTLGDYTITYTVTDSFGNVTSVTRVITVIEATEGGTSVVVNPNFTGTDGWTFDVLPERGTMAYVGETVVINLTNLGDAFWNVQLFQDGISIEAGKNYLVSFTVSTDTPRTIGLGIEDTADGYADIKGEPFNVEIGETATTYYYVLTSDRTIDSAKLALFLGKIAETDAPGEIIVYDFNMVEADEQNILNNSNFASNDSWNFDFPVGTGSMNTVDNQLVADITDVGTEWWHIQLHQTDVTIDTGVSYLVTFRVSSSVARRIGLGIEDPANGYADLKAGDPVEWDIDDTMTTYSYIFNSNDTVNTAKFALFFGYHTEGDAASIITVENFMVIRLYE